MSAAALALRPPPYEGWVPSVAGESAEIWAVGDSDGPAERRIAKLIRRHHPDRVLYLGDVYPHGTAGDFRRWGRGFGSLVKRMAPTPGNHDWPRARSGYDPFWRTVTGKPTPTYYAFDAAGWRIMSVNSEYEEHGAVEAWLHHEVRYSGTCRIAFWHRPRYNAGRHGDDRGMKELWDALRGRARIVVNGHDHNMQRMKPRHGLVEFVSGAGGRTRYDVDERDRRLAFSNDKVFGALRLQLSPERAVWSFVSSKGRVLDSGSLGCQEIDSRE
jgi:hypothetical protein